MNFLANPTPPNWYSASNVYYFGFFFKNFLFFLISYLFYTYQCIQSIPISQFIPPPSSTPCFPPLVSICLFSTSVSLFLPCKPVHLYHFSRFPIYELIYDICFSLSDLLHSVWQSLGPSTCLQVTQGLYWTMYSLTERTFWPTQHFLIDTLQQVSIILKII